MTYMMPLANGEEPCPDCTEYRGYPHCTMNCSGVKLVRDIPDKTFGNKDAPRYGRTRASRIRRRIDALRKAVRSEGTPAIQDAWDDLEAFLPYLMQENNND